jgi:suppressor of fused
MMLFSAGIGALGHAASLLNQEIESSMAKEKNKEPGWESIQNALRNLYGNKDPQHFGTVQRYADGGNDPLDGISAYAVDSPQHWHFIGFGLSELYEKESSNPEISGWGFELTFRLVREKNNEDCPVWPIQLLQTLARYVFDTQEIFDDGHYISMGGPITKNGSPEMTGLVFAIDPQLPEIKTQNGSVKFVQVICVTGKELRWIEKNSAEEFITLFAQNNPLLMSDISA